MRTELAVVLGSAAFARSPVLSRLLTYLAEESIAGRAGRLKSYTVAVDGLGREPDHDPQLDTYSRVTMVRLRRALDTFYQQDARAIPRRLSIPLGSYEVRLVPVASPAAGEEPLATGGLTRRSAKTLLLRRRSWPLVLAAAGVVLVVGLLALQGRFTRDGNEAAVWEQNNFPNVLVTMNGSPEEPATAEQRAIAELVRETIRPYETIRFANVMRGDVNYIVDLRLPPQGGHGRVLAIHVMNIKLNRVVFATEVPADGHDHLGGASRLALYRAVYAIVGYAGQIESLESRNSAAPDTPYECWLRFSQQVQIDPMSVDAELSECARKWFESAPQHPMAVFTYAWSETNDAFNSISPSTRERKLRRILKLLETAHARYPDSRHLKLALARTYAFLGYIDSVRQVVKGLSSPERPNPDLSSFAGTFMLLENDPAGEVLVDAAIAFHPDPPARYFLGKFVAAMMRDDVTSAGKALDNIVVKNRSSLWGQVFQAAYLARTGNVPAARAAWKLAVGQRPALGFSPRVFISASPAAPEVEARLLAWLAPVIN